VNLASLLRQGIDHHQAGRFREAELIYRQILTLDPVCADAWHLLGMIAHEAGHNQMAIDFIGRAIPLNPAQPGYFNNLGIIYKKLEDLEQARGQFLAALRLQPDYAAAQNNLADLYKEQGLVREAVAGYRQAAASQPDSPRILSNLLYTLNFDPDLSPQALMDEHCSWGQRFGSPPEQRRQHANSADPERPLRIGYVSPDFSYGATMRFFEPLLDNHDRSQFRVFLYGEVAHPDATTLRLQTQADGWRPTFGLPAAEVARQIESDQIDLLIDLGGQTAGNRLDVLACKPAPVQVAYLVYPHSTGLAAIDYRLTDAIVDPPGRTIVGPEQLVWLPGCFFSFQPLEAAPEVGPLPALRQGRVTFAAPHHLFKVNDAVLALYRQVLEAVPDARLAFIRSVLNPSQIDLLSNRLLGAGVALDRIDFIRPGPREDYLRYAAGVDVMLDTFPFCGQTTTCEYLWMGVPPVTLCGDRPSARISASIVTRLGLPELVAATPQEYVAIARRLASDIPGLARLRAELRERFRNTLGQRAAQTRLVEAAYREMWRTWCRSPGVSPGPRNEPPFAWRKFPGVVWPHVPLPQASSLWAAYGELDRTQWLEPAAIVEGQLAQARVLLSHCLTQVPYYREHLRQAGIEPAGMRTPADFRRIPLLQRRTYQEQFPRFQADTLPPGMVKTKQDRTSGTSGMPIEVWHTNLVNLWWLAIYLRDLHWSRIDPRGSLAVLRYLGLDGLSQPWAKQGLELPCWNSNLEPLLETGPAYAMDTRQDPHHQLQWLLRIQPNYLLGYPPTLEFLAGLLQESGRRLHNLRAIQTIAEALTGDTRDRIQKGFGVDVKNIYSCVEGGTLATSCPLGHGLHIHAESVLLEVLDDQDQPCRPGETGRVVLTTLHNYLTPFIRYELLDAATLGPERCPCGRGLPVLTQVQGKRRPRIPAPDGRSLDSHNLFSPLAALGVHRQHQIVQRALDHIIVRLVPNQSWAEDSTQRVVQTVREFFGTPVRVEVQLLDKVESTIAGKARDFISELELPG